MQEPSEGLLDVAERIAVRRTVWTSRNLSFVRLKHRQGLTAGVIYQRIQERMVWDGPFPGVAEIEDVIRERMT